MIDHADAPAILMPVEYRTRKLKAHHQPGADLCILARSAGDSSFEPYELASLWTEIRVSVTSLRQPPVAVASRCSP
ncbi:MAG TPA: hypothetical protein VLG68_02540, partial [Gammaproteobacteria bacterium]|nr:hypothetical protein [Gammaproteobacteria bacterium]